MRNNYRWMSKTSELNDTNFYDTKTTDYNHAFKQF